MVIKMKKIKKSIFLIIFCVSFIIAIPFAIKSIAQSGILNTESENTEIQTVTESKSETPKEQTAVPTTEVSNIDEKYNFTNVSADYFQNALFIGDSRTVGLYEYGTLKQATYFANTGMSVYNVFSSAVSVPTVGKVKLTELLNKKDYGKIYVMLGINELGYNFEATVKKYSELLEAIKAAEPNAIIFIEANLHVTKSHSDSDKIFNNQNINRFNQEIKKFADGKTTFYIDINAVFDDENGSLDKKYTSDNAHVLGKYYADWSSWFCTKAILK